MNTVTVDREKLIGGLPPQYRDLVRTMLDTGASGSVKIGPMAVQADGLTLEFASVELVIGLPPRAKKGGAK